jgi:hypothetical protein
MKAFRQTETPSQYHARHWHSKPDRRIADLNAPILTAVLLTVQNQTTAYLTGLSARSKPIHTETNLTLPNHAESKLAFPHHFHVIAFPTETRMTPPEATMLDQGKPMQTQPDFAQTHLSLCERSPCSRPIHSSTDETKSAQHHEPLLALETVPALQCRFSLRCLELHRQLRRRFYSFLLSSWELTLPHQTEPDL